MTPGAARGIYGVSADMETLAQAQARAAFSHTPERVAWPTARTYCAANLRRVGQ